MSSGTDPTDSDDGCPGCGAAHGVRSQPAPCTACGMDWCTTLINPHLRAALAVIGLLPTPQQRGRALLDVMNAEVTRRSGKGTPAP